MPIKPCNENGISCYKWRDYGNGYQTRKQSEKQAATAYANGYYESFRGFKDYLSMTEAFNNPYKLTKTKDTTKRIYYSFTTEAGKNYLINFIKVKERNGSSYFIMFEDGNGSTSVTGAGDAFRVFATVIEAIKKEKSRLDEVDFIKFTAEEKSRQKLYKRMAEQIGSVLGYKYIKLTKDEDGDMIYIISKKQ